MTAFVHEATVLLGEGGDQGALGAAITARLCGHWQHEGACRWPHHTSIDRRDDDEISIRTVFSVEPSDEPIVRAEIRTALAARALDGPHGRTTWTVRGDDAVPPRADERVLADRLGRG